MNKDLAHDIMTRVGKWVDVSTGDRVYIIQPSLNLYQDDSWGWDQAFGTMVLAGLNQLEKTKAALLDMAVKVELAGYQPKVTRWNLHKKGWEKRFPWVWRIQTLFDQRFTTHTQQPLIAQALQISINLLGIDRLGRDFVERVANAAQLNLDWLMIERNRSGHNLVYFTTVFEVGEDRLDVWDEYNMTRGPIKFSKLLGGFVNPLFYALRYSRLKWDEEKIFNDPKSWVVEPVSTNVFVVREFLALAHIWDQMNQPEKAKLSRAEGAKISHGIEDYLWDNSANTYFPQARFNNKRWGRLEVLSIESLSPLMLPDLNIHRVKSLVHLIDQKFTGNYLIPVSPPTNRSYKKIPFLNPPIWRKNQIWGNFNWFLSESLRFQADRLKVSGDSDTSELANKLSNQIRLDTDKLVEKEGFREWYDSTTGVGGSEENMFWAALFIISFPMTFST